ncbi:hypothetical protein L873DRAFT_1809885 [Choiromyces venosus 120613-1]|uniref:Uncharacterized protein n=1 Tax=Choiromyces venosus 120613-1 TaxID=1336337 RepID=A0A3N4JGE3_9PEZI|nr:hypothetical protein L873DRAFT_1809885 [Choiromyces venosus 120613-1]
MCCSLNLSNPATQQVKQKKGSRESGSVHKLAHLENKETKRPFHHHYHHHYYGVRLMVFPRPRRRCDRC